MYNEGAGQLVSIRLRTADMADVTAILHLSVPINNNFF